MAICANNPNDASAGHRSLATMVAAAWSMLLCLVLGTLPAAAGEPVKLGVLLPFSGSLSANTPYMQNGVIMAVELIHQAMDSGGFPIRIISRDSRGEGQTVVETARKLIQADKVSAIIGPLTAEASIELVAEAAVPFQVPFISPSATSPDISGLSDDDFFFRTIPSDSFQGEALAGLAREQGRRKPAVLYVNNLYGRGLAKAFRAAVESLSGEVAAYVPFISGQASYRTEVERALAAGPDILLVAAHPEDGEKVLWQAADLGRSAKFLLPGTMKDQRIISFVGPGPLNGTWGAAPAVPNTRLAAKFRESYRESFGEPGGTPLLETSFDAAILLALASVKVLSLGGAVGGVSVRDSLRGVANPPGEKVDFTSLAKAVTLLKSGADIDYEGVSGPVDLDGNGDIGPGAYATWIIEDGVIKTIRIGPPGEKPR